MCTLMAFYTVGYAVDTVVRFRSHICGLFKRLCELWLMALAGAPELETHVTGARQADLIYNYYCVGDVLFLLRMTQPLKQETANESTPAVRPTGANACVCSNTPTCGKVKLAMSYCSQLLYA